LTQNSDTTAPSGRDLYHLQFSLQAASPETYGYNQDEPPQCCYLSRTLFSRK